MIKSLLKKKQKLSYEILFMIGKSAFIALCLFLILVYISSSMIEEYIFHHAIEMDEFDWMMLDQRIFMVGSIISCLVFVGLFLYQLKTKINIILTITKGIEDLQFQQKALSLPVEGNDELALLAQSINEMSAEKQKLYEKQQRLKEEREELIHTLSHDIRTPLTSIISYSEYLNEHEEIDREKLKTYLELIQKKAIQIQELSFILLDGNKRNLENFDDGKLLFVQIISEFESDLEDQFILDIDVSQCPMFKGCFDVQELRRIFDNLSSNIIKYADSQYPVKLTLAMHDQVITISQSNIITSQSKVNESYQIGLNSIRRIALLYGGQVSYSKENNEFKIIITLNDYQ